MKLKQQELKEDILRIWKIEILAKECFQISYYFHNPNTSEEAEYLDKHRELGFIRHILWRMTIIELSKLYSNSSERDRYNLKHFISKLKKGGYFGDMGISQASIEKWELALSVNQNQIKNILTLRDKIYAHTDPRRDDNNTIDLSFQDIEVLIKLAEDIIKEIYIVVFDADADMSPLIFDPNRFDMIKILATEKRKRIEEILGPRFTNKK